jgi:hypothetical protein
MTGLTRVAMAVGVAVIVVVDMLAGNVILVIKIEIATPQPENAINLKAFADPSPRSPRCRNGLKKLRPK